MVAPEIILLRSHLVCCCIPDSVLPIVLCNTSPPVTQQNCRLGVAMSMCPAMCRGAVDKDAITRGAGVASSNRYGSVIAGTLVAAVVIVGIAGTILVWRRRAGAYQGLHDTEMAMIRREH